MARRKVRFAEGELYHICAGSIQGYRIFNNVEEFKRMRDLIMYYLLDPPPCPYSVFAGSQSAVNISDIIQHGDLKLTNVISYCLMPTHIHLILEERMYGGITRFMGRILNSYAKFFNAKYGRRGPLWSGRFKSVHIGSDDELLHKTRYVHLNPVTAFLVESPEEWAYSSYREYVNTGNISIKLCDRSGHLDIQPERYRAFVMERKQEQRQLAKVKAESQN